MTNDEEFTKVLAAFNERIKNAEAHLLDLGRGLVEAQSLLLAMHQEIVAASANPQAKKEKLAALAQEARQRLLLAIEDADPGAAARLDESNGLNVQ